MKQISDKDFGAHFKLIKDFPNIGLKAGDRLYLVGIPKRMNLKKATEGMFVWENGGSQTVTLEAKHVEPWKSVDDLVLMANRSANTMTMRELLAAMAMQGILTRTGSGKPKEISDLAIEYADALLTSLSSPS